MEKVKITSEQKKLIDDLKYRNENDLNQTMCDHLQTTIMNFYGEYCPWRNEFALLNDITVAQMSLILFFDHYEVEMTKEEKLLDFYNKYLNDVDEFDAGVRHGIENILSIYGIEIEGITD